MLDRLRDGLDARTGHRASLSRLLDLPVPGGARFILSIGSAIAALCLLQALTGIVLACFYAPSSTAAWASVLFIEEKVVLGKLARGLHAWGADVLLVVLVLHYARAAWAGAYRAPREPSWLLGLALGLVVFGFVVTGYLLPFDQKAYSGTQVRAGIAAATPLVGPTMVRAMLGGDDVSTLTLSRFHALHTIVLPWALALIGALQLRLFLRNGPLPAWRVPADAPAVRWWPSQAARDLALSAALVALVTGLAIERGVDLDAPADPTSDYRATPEWYVLPLNQLVTFFPGRTMFVGSVVIPGLAFALIAALPWLDRGATRAPADRKRALAVAFAPLAAALGLGALGWVRWSSDEEIARNHAESARDGKLARELAKDGVPPEGPLALLDHDVGRLGRKTFRARCSQCHVVGETGKAKGPRLTGYLSRAWLEAVIRAPADPTLFGAHPEFEDGMGMTEGTRDEIEALAIYTRSLESADVAKALPQDKLAAGKKLFDEKSCGGCHERTKRSGDGPHLNGYGSREWLRDFLLQPGAKTLYDTRNKMPSFKGKLTDEELSAVIDYVRSLETGTGE